ncbi:chemotaxis protein CheW [Cesiribacter sp. SM1]|uniref:chemotaxis protein CheW n=1 Tax=Cesiribacter sp. SM1 TaxID=2861196 RepID=UPI001CD3585C|nr:chemotaxis protein CheW [Cesiribacter sp. SM1]
MEKEAVSRDSYLSFTLGEELFAIRVAKVKEILELDKITRVPHSPPYMKGVINLRGEVLSVVDTRIRFGLGLGNTTVNTCIMVLSLDIENEQINVGALVD